MSSFDPSMLAELAGKSLWVNGYRNQATGFDPRSGDGARRFGGRFNPLHSYPVVYLCTTRPCVVAELTRQARRQGQKCMPTPCSYHGGPAVAPSELVLDRACISPPRTLAYPGRS